MRGAPEVLEAMRPYLDEMYFNSSSVFQSSIGPFIEVECWTSSLSVSSAVSTSQTHLSS